MMITVKKARQLKEMTQRQMAGEMGISRDTYRKIECNPNCATIEQAKAIARLTGFTVEQIFFARDSTESRDIVNEHSPKAG